MSDNKTLVYEALDNASEGGYGDFVFDGEIEELVNDLCRNAPDLENVRIDEMRTHIKAWRKEQSTATIKMFFYGSIKRGYYNHERLLKGAKFLGEAVAPGIALDQGRSFPFAFLKDGAECVGELFEVPKRRLAYLDGVELGAGYQRSEHNFQLGDKIVKAFIYVVSSDRLKQVGTGKIIREWKGIPDR